MKITHDKVYDLAESIVASGLPMKAEYDETDFRNETINITAWTCFETTEDSDKCKSNLNRAERLASNPSGSGHCNFLSGVLVSMNVTATNAWFLQAERYHFFQIVSCMSKMHRLRKMIDNAQYTTMFNKKTDITAIIRHSTEGVDMDDETLAYSCPMGLELTARITTNYLQLKTIYNQRKNHRLTEWRDFCAWIESLPMSKMITGNVPKTE